MKNTKERAPAGPRELAWNHVHACAKRTREAIHEALRADPGVYGTKAAGHSPFPALDKLATWATAAAAKARKRDTAAKTWLVWTVERTLLTAPVFPVYSNLLIAEHAGVRFIINAGDPKDCTVRWESIADQRQFHQPVSTGDKVGVRKAKTLCERHARGRCRDSAQRRRHLQK